ncbi:MAG: discoidin domain-containing protein, partial [Planctomycetota bacterium]
MGDDYGLRGDVKMRTMLCLALMTIASALVAGPAAAAENLALRATASASSGSGAARFACDGHIPRALKQTDSGLAWMANGNNHPDGVTFTLAWPGEVTIAELIYYGRTAWCNENWKDYEVSVGTEQDPVLKGVLLAGHGPQRLKLPHPVRTTGVSIKFLSHYGGPNPGASEIQAYAESPPDELLGEFVAFDKIVPYRNLVRFKLVEPTGTTYYVNLGGYIHNPPWYIPRAVWPENADKDAAQRIASGEFTPWFDLGKHAGHLIHRRMNRSGGVAEFPNVTVDFVASGAHDSRKVVIQLAEQPEGKPDETRIVKQFEESFTGSSTSFLVSPNLEEDKDSLESASQMTGRRLAWARAASGGHRASPTNLIVQTSFYGAQRPDLDLQEAEALWLLGFNVVDHMTPAMRAQFPALRAPGHTQSVDYGPAATPEAIDALMKGHAGNQRETLAPGVPAVFDDEVNARPPIGDNAKAREHFHAWLAARGLRPKDLGVAKLEDVVPIETPDSLRAAEKTNTPAARRVFYYTSRFRQEAGTERFRWLTEAFHRHFPAGLLASTLVADHPYFSGTGLGLGLKTSNFTWGGYPLALDWFDLARHRAVDLAGIED